MKRGLIIQCFILFPLLTIAQSSIIYKFVVESRTQDSLKAPYLGIEHEFAYRREFINKNVFREVGLFSAENSTELFKKKNGAWFFKVGSKWKLLFSKRRKNIEPIIKIGGQFYKLRAIGTKYLCNIQCVVYSAHSINNDVSSVIKYWFNPDFGFIKIDSPEIKLVRLDIIR